MLTANFLVSAAICALQLGERRDEVVDAGLAGAFTSQCGHSSFSDAVDEILGVDLEARPRTSDR